MDWSNITTVSNAFGGILVLLYAFWTIYNKVASDLNILTKRQKDKREQKEKEEEEKYKKLVADVSLSIRSDFSITVNALNDLLRIEINNVYYKYNHYRKILRYDKENCAKMIEDYAAQGGNSYVRDLWEEMCEWEVVSTWDEVIR